ncbi:MAG: zinc ribbon domain-containing protein [Lachnospiraceae bacterium]|nr:zinc ribbon domain-containing protein [Lachnospiraceae bacterium]
MQVQAELVRRRNVHTGPNGQKRIYSGNNCFSHMVICGECGELYRRVHWNNHGYKSIVWRCISRLEPSRAAMNCTSRTVKEELMQKVTTKAFNQILNDKDGFLRQVQENIAKAITTADTMIPDGIQARLDEL